MTAVSTPGVVAEPTRPAVARGLFLTVCAGNFLVLLDTSILNVALPDVAKTLHSSSTLLPWTSVAYTVVFSGLLLASGAVSDRFGARRLYRASLLAFAAFSLFCAAAPTIGTLIGARALLGVAAAGMVPASLALLASLFPDPRERGRAIGTWAAVTSSGLVAGPLLGGLLVTAGGWRLVFLVNPPIALVCWAFSGRLPTAVAASVRRLDRPGVTVSIVALCALSYSFISGGTVGWSRPGPLIGLAIGAVAIGALAFVERRSDHPVLAPDVVRSRGVQRDVLAAAVASLVFYGILFTLTLWYERQRGFSPLQTGLAFVPMTLPMCVLPRYTGRLISKFGARRLIVFGLSCDVAAGLLLSFVATSSPLVWIVVAEVALVLGSTTTIPAATADVAIVAPAQYAGSAQGALNAARQGAAALGVAILGPMTSMRGIGITLAVVAVVAVTLAAVPRDHHP